MIHDLIIALGWPIGPEVALGLYTAVHTDTGSFRYSNTTPRTFRIAAALTAAGAEPALVTDRLYQRRPKDALPDPGPPAGARGGERRRPGGDA